MSLRPCPNPACRSTNIEGPACVGMPVDEYISCRDCGMRGPQSDMYGALWNALPRIDDTPATPETIYLPSVWTYPDTPASPAALSIDERADIAIRLAAHWYKRNQFGGNSDVDDWTGCDDDVLRRAIREAETWDAVQERRNDND